MSRPPTASFADRRTEQATRTEACQRGYNACMRRLAGISALVLIFLSTSLWAQRRVGSVGIRSGFAPRGGVSFHAPVPRAGITIRTFPGPFTRFHRGFVYRPYWRYGYPGYYGYYGYAGYYDPFLWGSASSYSYDNSSNYNAYYDQSQQLAAASQQSGK